MNTNSTFKANFNSGFEPLVELGIAFANWLKRSGLLHWTRREPVQGDLFGASA
ncbi:MAG: hypothetical protein VX871_00815 [Pseudomonadota bacterium]|nr:hypothetical protein [Pseudomonadota bacterium]